MRFIEPFFLWALTAISVPIIIHLFNFRRFKKVYFPDLRFIKAVQLQKQSRSKLKRLLILASRILALASLVFAFAQPYIPFSGSKSVMGTRAISLFVDNSYSMQALSEGGTILDEAKNSAKGIAAAYAPGDYFQILTADFDGASQRLVSRDEAVENIKSISSSPSVKRLSEIINRQKDALSGSSARNKIIYVVSDFQKTICDWNNIRPDSNYSIYLIPVKSANSADVYVDSCWFVKPVRQFRQNEDLIVRVRNNGEEAMEKVPVKLFINGTQKALASVDIPAKGEAEVHLPFLSDIVGINNCRVELVDYPVVYDDKLYFSFSVNKQIKVLQINDESSNPYIDALFKGDSLFDFNNADNARMDMSSLRNNSFIILNSLKTISGGLTQELLTFVNEGGSLLVIPPISGDLNGYSALTQSLGVAAFGKADTSNVRVGMLNMMHPVYKDVFDDVPENIALPMSFMHYDIQQSNRSASQVLIALANKAPFLMTENRGKGKVYMLASPLNKICSDFQNHAIFVPTMLKMAFYSNPSYPLYHWCGQDAMLEVVAPSVKGEEVFKIKSVDGSFSFIPEHRNIGGVYNIFTHDQINDAGNYVVEFGDKQLIGTAFNYDRNESKLQCLSKDEIEEALKVSQNQDVTVINSAESSLMKDIVKSYQGIRLWKWFVVAALTFLLVEMLLLRFFRD